MAVQPPGRPSIPSPSPGEIPQQQLAEQLKTSLNHFIQQIKEMSEKPHFVDDKEFLTRFANGIKETHQLAQKAIEA